jgi:hypothetical protein
VAHHPPLSAGEKLNLWWTYDHAPTRWAIVGSFVVAWFLAIVFLFSDIVKVLAARPWWEDFIVAVATAAVPILAFLELRHSDKANRLRAEANELRAEANQLSEQNGRLNADLNAERNQHLAQIASGINRVSQEPAASLRIYPRNSSRYILKPVGQGGPRRDVKGGHFQFWLRVENSGNRNSAVDKYKIWIQEFDKEFDGIVPIQVGSLVPGRFCQHGVGNEKYLNEANLIIIPPDNSTSVGCLWFFLPELTLEMFANAGVQTQGPEHRFGDLHCRLTVTDSNGISASGDFECHED